MAGFTVSHEDIVAEYQRRLTAVTHENVMLGLLLQQAQQQPAAAPNPPSTLVVGAEQNESP